MLEPEELCYLEQHFLVRLVTGDGVDFGEPFACDECIHKGCTFSLRTESLSLDLIIDILGDLLTPTTAPGVVMG